MASRSIHPANHLVDLAAAAVPAAAAGWAVAKIAPLAGYPTSVTAAVASLLTFLLAFGAMRRSGATQAGFTVPTFVPPAMDEAAVVSSDKPDRYEAVAEVLVLDVPLVEIEDELVLDQLWIEKADELVLDRPYVDQQVDELAELLLDDPLVNVPVDSRVVRLFAPQRLPTAGQLAERIDRHLGHESVATLAPSRDDVHDPLREALDELRRSLRRA